MIVVVSNIHQEYHLRNSDWLIFSEKVFNSKESNMPTIIALDVSLSMTKSVPITTNGTHDENITYNQLAIEGINDFLNYLTKNSKLEYVSLVSFEHKHSFSAL